MLVFSTTSVSKFGFDFVRLNSSFYLCVAETALNALLPFLESLEKEEENIECPKCLWKPSNAPFPISYLEFAAVALILAR